MLDSKKIGLGLLLIFLNQFYVWGSEADITKAIIFSTVLPGGGHLYLKEYKDFSFYLSGELALALFGRQIKNKLEENEQNIFYLHAYKLHELNIFSAYRKARILSKNKDYSFPMDTTPLTKLYSSPFHLTNLKDKYVWGFAMAGAVLNAIEGYLNKERKNYDKISSVKIIGKNYNRNDGFFIYQGLWIPISLNSAVSEECVWRGLVQSEWERFIGRKAGLLVSSAFFGFSHVYKPTETKYWIYGVEATLAGIYLGWVYQRNNYQLEKPIAAHFWFNVLGGTALFLIDPESNPLGIKVNFGF